MAGRVTLLAAAALLACSATGAAAADGCAKSRDYILEGMAGDLTKSSLTYQQLFKTCIETLTMPNVKDAYILKAGLIAIDPQRNTVMATASTLAQFCRRFPRGTLHFVPAKEARKAANTAVAVRMSSTRATPCEKIMGQ